MLLCGTFKIQICYQLSLYFRQDDVQQVRGKWGVVEEIGNKKPDKLLATTIHVLSDFHRCCLYICVWQLEYQTSRVLTCIQTLDSRVSQGPPSTTKRRSATTTHNTQHARKYQCHVTMHTSQLDIIMQHQVPSCHTCNTQHPQQSWREHAKQNKQGNGVRWLPIHNHPGIPPSAPIVRLYRLSIGCGSAL